MTKDTLVIELGLVLDKTDYELELDEAYSSLSFKVNSIKTRLALPITMENYLLFSVIN